jgi:hypothetical protein
MADSTHRERFVQEGLCGRERTAVGFGVVRDTWRRPVHGAGVREAVHRTSVHVHLGTRAERGQPGSRALGQQIGGVAETHERGHDTLPIARNAASVHIAGQDDVPELGVPVGLASGMVVQSGTTVDEEDAGALVAPRLIEHHDTVVPARGSGNRSETVAALSIVLPRPLDEGFHFRTL